METSEKIALMKQWAKAGFLPDGRKYTYANYFHNKADLLKKEEKPITEVDIIKTFGGTNEKD